MSKFFKILHYIDLAKYTPGTKVLKLVLWINIVCGILIGLTIYFYAYNILFLGQDGLLKGHKHSLSIQIESWIIIVLTIVQYPLSIYLIWKGIKTSSRKCLQVYLITISLIIIPINFIIHMHVQYFSVGIFSKSVKEFGIEDYLQLAKNIFISCLLVFIHLYLTAMVYNCYKKLGSPLLLRLRDHSTFLKNRQSSLISSTHQNYHTESPRRSLKSQDNPLLQFEKLEGKVSHQQFEEHIINPLDILIDFEKILGEGQFGRIYLAKLQRNKCSIKCAAKVIKDNQNVESFGMLLQEMKIMIRSGQHENIVEFFGVTTDPSILEHFAVITELCEGGSLDDFLLKKRHTFMNFIRESGIKFHPEQPLEYINLDEHGTHSSTDLVRFATEIVRGMEHLASKHIIHGDLAIRNVLLTQNLTIKLSDFGFSHRLYNYQLYSRIETNKKCFLPWRWMSIEAIEDLKFSEKSDVWAYGVVLWEIFSLAEIPFKDFQWSPTLPQQIRNGLQLQRPRYATSEIYCIMQMCWKIHKDTRPDFCHLRQAFERILKEN